MTVHNAGAVSASTCSATPLWRAMCSCGWEAPKSTTSKGAAAFSASAHVKKANGQPVFAKKDAAHPAVVEAERIVAAVADVKHAQNRSGEPLCHPFEQSVQFLASYEDQADCPDCLRVIAERNADQELQAVTPGYILPATLVKAPSDEYEIRGYKSIHAGREGDAFEATLYRRGKKVAHVSDVGCGGEIDVEFLDRAPGEYWGANTPEKQAFAAWVELWEGKWDYEYNLDWTFVGVVDTLIQEAVVLKELNGKRTRTPVLEAGESPRTRYHTFNTRDLAQVRAYLLKTGKADARIWDGKAWTPVAELEVAS